jgi:hypothetical protein
MSRLEPLGRRSEKTILAPPRPPDRPRSARLLSSLLLALSLLPGGVRSDEPAAASRDRQSPSSASPSSASPSSASPSVGSPGGEQADPASRGHSSPDPQTLVLGAIQRAVWGPPLACKIRQRTRNEAATLVGVGQLWQAGQGTGRVRLDLHWVVDRQQHRLQQVSDGRLLWTSLQHDQSTELSRIDLSRLREALGGIWRQDVQDHHKTLGLAVGGSAETLRSLHHRYGWSRVQAAKWEGENVWHIFGSARSQPAEPNGRAPVDHEAWQSPSAPSDVRLTLLRGGDRNLCPLEIEWFEASTDPTEPEGRSLQSVGLIEYHDIRSPTTIDPELFGYQVHQEAEAIGDRTLMYLPPGG